VCVCVRLCICLCVCVCSNACVLCNCTHLNKETRWRHITCCDQSVHPRLCWSIRRLVLMQLQSQSHFINRVGWNPMFIPCDVHLAISVPNIPNIELARTMYIRYIYGNIGRKTTKYTVIYGIYIRFWPTPRIYTRNIWFWPILLMLVTAQKCQTTKLLLNRRQECQTSKLLLNGLMTEKRNKKGTVAANHGKKMKQSRSVADLQDVGEKFGFTSHKHERGGA